jgi:putative transposase
MSRYVRPHSPGATWFCTVALADRKDNQLLVEHIDELRESIHRVRKRHPFTVDAMVVLPEHLHALWTLPPGDTGLGLRWGLIKAGFSRRIPEPARRRESHAKRGERGLWQRRFWEHLVRDERDLEAHMNYIHYNPVKHGWVQRVADWPHSSFHRYVRLGWYPPDWGSTAPSLMRGME